MNQSYFAPKDVAQACGVSQWLVTRYIRHTQPNKHPKAWARLNESQFRAVCEHLAQLKAQCPKQPLHALKINR